jgi:hypothetical protein
MSDLDKQIALGFEALGSNENFRHGLATAIIHEAKRRRNRTRKIVAIWAAAILIVTGIAYSMRHSTIIFGSGGGYTSATTHTYSTPDGLGITRLPFTTYLTFNGDGRTHHNEWVIELAPSQVVEFVTDIRGPQGGQEASIEIYSMTGDKPDKIIERFSVATGTGIQEFGAIPATGKYLIRFNMLDGAYSGRVRFIAVRMN